MERVYIDFAEGWGFQPENGIQRPIKISGGWLKQGIDSECGVYRKKVIITDVMRQGITFLVLEAVNHLAEVFVIKSGNRKKIHEEVTAFTAQRIDLTPYLEGEESIELEIFVRAFENGRPIAPHCAEWCEYIARGIFRGIYLEITPTVYIRDIFVKPSVREKCLYYEVSVYNGRERDERGRLEFDIKPHNGCNFEYSQIDDTEFEVQSGKESVIRGRANWNLGMESYWWPNVPYEEGYRTVLHLFHIKLFLGDQLEDETCCRFGFRELWQDKNRFIFNGIKINFRGDNLQTANYDRIDFGGRGDAIGTLPGFLPPSEDNQGWPKAVDNFLRLNYNIQREHMAPWTPYMLDVCDEKGLMLIGESACRWDGFDMDGGKGRHELKCLCDMVKRDRNHPSIVRWCLKNETQCAEPEYHEALYEAVKAVDDTRPLYEEFITGDRKNFNPEQIFSLLQNKNDFTWMEHYLTCDDLEGSFFSTTQFNDALIPMENRPYGITESNFIHGSTPQGITWFATSTALFRAQGAADIRPYTLLSAWCSCIPGTDNRQMITEEGRNPLYGENNLKEPWSNESICLLQRAYHPYLVMDTEFWKMNKEGDMMGHFPVSFPEYHSGDKITRKMLMFNDTFQTEELTLCWQAREGNFANRSYLEGYEAKVVEPGEFCEVDIILDTPGIETIIFLTLQVLCRGKIVFEDNSMGFQLTGGEEYRGDFTLEERLFR